MSHVTAVFCESTATLPVKGQPAPCSPTKLIDFNSCWRTPAYKKLTLFNGMKLFGLHAEQALDFSLRVMQTLLLRCDVGRYQQGLDCPPARVRVQGRSRWATTLTCGSRLQ